MSKAIQPRYLDGAALREARAVANLEQAELAERAGVTQGQVSGWERGHTGCRLRTLHKLANALGVEPLALMRRQPAVQAGSADPAVSDEDDPEPARKAA